MAHHEVLFPTDVTPGSSGGPGFRVLVVGKGQGEFGGGEERVARQSAPRWRWELRKLVQTNLQLAIVQRFYLARGGVQNSWLLKDFADYYSNPNDPTYTSAPDTMDQLIGTGTGATGYVFQLVKRYTDGVGPAKVRTIRKPVAGTVSVWVNGVLKTEGVDYTVDLTTGEVTYPGTITYGHQVHASFAFYCVARFGEEIDDAIMGSIDAYNITSVESIPAVEELFPDVGYVGDMFYGGSYETTFGVNISISPGNGALQRLAATASGLSVALTNPSSMQTGKDVMCVENGGATHSFLLKDHLGATLATLAAGAAIDVHLGVDSGGAKVWRAI